MDRVGGAQAARRTTDANVVKFPPSRWFVCAACCLAVFASSCSGSAPESIAFADDAPLVTEPTVGSFSPAEQELITFHASWLCEMQRRTFASLGDSDIARSEALAITDIDHDRYDTFLVDDLPRQVVRDAVLWSYQQQCRAE